MQLAHFQKPSINNLKYQATDRLIDRSINQSMNQSYRISWRLLTLKNALNGFFQKDEAFLLMILKKARFQDDVNHLYKKASTFRNEDFPGL